MAGALLLVNKGRPGFRRHSSYIGGMRNPSKKASKRTYERPSTKTYKLEDVIKKMSSGKKSTGKIVKKSSANTVTRKRGFKHRRRTRGGVIFYQTRSGQWRMMPKHRFISRRKAVTKKRKYKKRRYSSVRRKKASTVRRRRPVRRLAYRRDDNPVRRRRRRYFRSYRRSDNPWFESPHPGKRHRAAAKKGWKYRRRGVRYYKGKRIPLVSKWTGYRYRKPRGYSAKRHHFPIWRNPMMLGESGIIAPLALAALGFIGSAAIMANLPDSIKDKMLVGENKFNVGAVAIPLAVGLGLMFLAPKVPALQPYTKHLFFAAVGFGVAGVVSGIGQAVKGTEFGKKIGFSGYVKRPLLSGYVRRPMLSGYTVARSLGQVDTQLSVPAFETAGAPAPAIKPFGVGMPTETRRYNEFDFGGVYGRSVYER